MFERLAFFRALPDDAAILEDRHPSAPLARALRLRLEIVAGKVTMRSSVRDIAAEQHAIAVPVGRFTRRPLTVSSNTLGGAENTSVASESMTPSIANGPCPLHSLVWQRHFVRSFPMVRSEKGLISVARALAKKQVMHTTASDHNPLSISWNNGASAMIDAKRLLDQFLGAGQNSNAGFGGRDAQGPEAGGSRQAAGAGGVLSQVQDYARSNPMLAGGLAGGLATVFLGSKGGRKLAKSALTYGGIAAIGGLAYKAYRDYQAGQASGPQEPARTDMRSGRTPLLPPPADSPFAIANAPQGADAFALELVGAMIAAAKADGHIDDRERQQILGKLSEGGLDGEEADFLARELSTPLDIERVVRSAKNKEEAVELYAASFLAITPDHPAERAYLDMLAARLGLEPELAKTVETTVAGAQA